MAINKELFMVLLFSKQNPSKLKYYNANTIQGLIKILRNNPLWPQIEMKKSRTGTLEELHTNTFEYICRGGTTALLSNHPSPMQRIEVKDI